VKRPEPVRVVVASSTSTPLSSVTSYRPGVACSLACENFEV
jgi:hypothetical protein